MRHIGTLGTLGMGVALSACGTQTAPPAPAATPAAGLTDTTTYDHGEEHRHIAGGAIALEALPIADWLGLPMSGTAAVDLDVRIPVASGKRDWAHATGALTFHCDPCQLGAEGAKLPVPAQSRRASALVGEGIELGTVLLGRVDIAATLAGGKLAVTKWDVASPELQLTAKLDVTFDADGSHVESCVRYRPTDALRGRAPKTFAAISTAGGAPGPDGMGNIRLAGSLDELRRLAQVCDGSVPLPPIDATPPGPQRPELVPDPAPPVDDAALLAGVAKVDATHYTVKRAVIDAVLANPMQFAKGARMVPAVKAGAPDGFKLYAIQADSLFARLGLQNGDLLQAVNGFSLTSADKALEAYTKLRDASTVSLDIVRAGQPLTLAYTIGN